MNTEELFLSPEQLKAFKIKRTIFNVFVYVFLSLVAIAIIVPFGYMLFSSFQTGEAVKGVVADTKDYYYVEIEGTDNIARIEFPDTSQVGKLKQKLSEDVETNFTGYLKGVSEVKINGKKIKCFDFIYLLNVEENQEKLDFNDLEYTTTETPIATVVSQNPGEYKVKGIVVAIDAAGFIMTDSTGYVYVSKGDGWTPNVVVGNEIVVSGMTELQNGVISFSKENTHFRDGNKNYTKEYCHFESEVLSASNINEYVENEKLEVKYATIKGKVLEDKVKLSTKEYLSNYFTISNYKNTLGKFSTSNGEFSMITMFGNTLLVATITTIGTVISVVFSAFAFARLNFKGKELLFSALLATMMIPGEIFIISNYQTLSGYKDTYVALVLPFMTSVFYTFYLRQTFRQIPNELYLAARVDGLGDFGYLFKIMIPIAKATILTITILSMIGTWNALVWPSLMTNDPGKFMVSNGLTELSSMLQKILNVGPTSGKLLATRMAASTVITVPLLIVFICLRKYIMGGVSRSGIKG